MSTKPNIIVITTDQQHHTAVSALGNEYLHTPGMDAIYEKGIVFNNAYSTNPVCGPARSSILTGRMPCETGVYDNGMNIRKGIPNLGRWFSDAGYNTVYAGKWHLRDNFSSSIDGFDVIMTGINIQCNASDTGITSSVEAYLRNYDDDKPFMLMAMYVQPHDICGFVNYFTDEQDMLYEIPENELPPLPSNFYSEPAEPVKFKNFKSRIPSTRGNWDEKKWRYYLWHYYRYVEGVDCEISRLLTVLNDTGMSDNTIVVFASDHGENAAHHRTTLKTTLYNESCRVPMAIRIPKADKKTVVSEPVSLMDIFPTLCDFADIGQPENMTGRDLMSDLRDRSGVPIESYGGSGRAFAAGKYKVVAFNNGDQSQLFDLENDPFETKNLCKDVEYSDILVQMLKLMDNAFSTMDMAECLPEENKWPSY